MTLVMVALRLATSTPALPELMADWLTKFTPSIAFDFLLERLQVAAKPLFFSSILVGQVSVGGGLGILYARYSSRLPLREEHTWQRGTLIAFGLWLVIMLLITPVIGGGPFGLSLPRGVIAYIFVTLVSLIAFAFSLTQLHSIALSYQDASFSFGRREFIRRAVYLGLLVAAGGLALRTILRGASSFTPSKLFDTPGQLPQEVTPNDQFYEVSKNIVNPRVDAVGWKLELAGDFGNPFTLTYDELKALPWKEEYVTLTCISNLIGGELISNALWRGVPLKLLLERAEMAPKAERLAFHAADGYIDSFPAQYALRDNVLVAYLMNGEPLPHDHGFPARIIVPGLYGMENVKWLTRIETVSANFRGYWQQRGWADTAVIKTMSRIDAPTDRARVALAETLVGGVAFAGDRGVTKVEVSFDGGVTWHPSEVRKPLSPYTWVLWTRQWSPVTPKTHKVLVRATDRTGDTQTGVVEGSLPDGATGYHGILVTVERPEASS
jgi:DMSO/TMAO reductase YedYZ molybdopterin-dependent catalytic subunit